MRGRDEVSGDGRSTTGGNGAPLLSVVIPCYNGAATLPAAVRSAQRFSALPKEIVVVDDGSTDATPDLGAALESEHPNLRWLRRTNGGLSAARNFGIAHCRGTWLVLLDADDELIPVALDAALASGADAIRLGVEEVGADGRARRHDESFAEQPGRAYLQACCTAQRFFPASWAWLYRLSLLREHGLRFREGIVHEDMLFTVQALLAAQRVTSAPTGYRYYKRPGSITMAPGAAALTRRLASLRVVVDGLVDAANAHRDIDLGWWTLYVLDYAAALARQAGTVRARLLYARTVFGFFARYRAWGREQGWSAERWRLAAAARFVLGRQ